MEQRALRENCGVFGVWSRSIGVAQTVFYGLYVLQHRGQESAGMCLTDGTSLFSHKGMGLVSQIFTEEHLFATHPSIAGIGHTRYATAGESILENAQPLEMPDPFGVPVALGHNGTVVNADEVRSDLQEQGYFFVSQTDTEVLMRYLLTHGRSWKERFSLLMGRMSAAYSLVILTPDRLMAARDPYGIRPLCVGKIEGGFVVASESCALAPIGAEYLRAVRPGEVVMIDDSGMQSMQVASSPRHAHCSFEHIYFARPDSLLDESEVYGTRVRLGEELAREHPADADIVIGVPDSGTPHAIGYAEGSGIPYAEGLIKNRYVQRTFIAPDQRLRDLGARLKYGPISKTIAGKRVVVVDDSIVRGTTMPNIVSLLRDSSAREVHVRVAAPPIQHPCYLGVDMASYSELIAAQHSTDEICEQVGADSLAYLSVEGLRRVVAPDTLFCDACFTGEYPVDVSHHSVL
ncbi:MAG: amidophosphoribosyltransferase [Candidatus Spechtbacteria bacterium SB0662_bin_43]|uniref:Amidophosphoribosyltransferase n=1 Tax=Candidatus Spechtbacteria bacterium SB0662_bin_43 TaxID=2604897 RepID=A0A845D8L0_9BACT|nr:amidophosphoribosyltransferase [Candidatus Spechtbacteria bacterium SB0662_bin_43]